MGSRYRLLAWSLSWKTSRWIIASCLNKFSLEIHLDAASSLPASLLQWRGTGWGGEAAVSCCLQRWPHSSCKEIISVLIRLLGGLQQGGMWIWGLLDSETIQNCSALCCCPVAALKPHCSALGCQLEMQTGKCNGLTFASISPEPLSARQIFAGDIDTILES